MRISTGNNTLTSARNEYHFRERRSVSCVTSSHAHVLRCHCTGIPYAPCRRQPAHDQYAWPGACRSGDNEAVGAAVALHDAFQRMLAFFPGFRIADKAQDFILMGADEVTCQRHCACRCLVGNAMAGRACHLVDMAVGGNGLPAPAASLTGRTAFGAFGRTALALFEIRVMQFGLGQFLLATITKFVHGWRPVELQEQRERHLAPRHNASIGAIRKPVAPAFDLYQLQG